MSASSPLPPRADAVEAIAASAGVVRATLIGACAWALLVGAWLLY